jgi:hypothetical protein
MGAISLQIKEEWGGGSLVEHSVKSWWCKVGENAASRQPARAKAVRSSITLQRYKGTLIVSYFP